jgi:DNA-binding transcriptional MerR regulator
VQAILQAEYPDISISKIRFLESEGLINPERAPSGYRKYSEADIDRLRFILDAQKNRYLPLNVIKEQLEALDRGESIADPSEPEPEQAQSTKQPARPAAPKREIRATRRQLIEASGISEATFNELEKSGLIKPRRGTIYYDRDALTIATVARKLATYGIDARHLRTVKQSAEREVGLIEQAVTPYLRRNPMSRGLPAEVMKLILYAHAAMMRSMLN